MSVGPPQWWQYTARQAACLLATLLCCNFLIPESALADSILAERSNFKLIRVANKTTAATVALRYLGNMHEGWQISELNGRSSFRAGDIVAIPDTPVNPGSVFARGSRSIPILCYHQLTTGLSVKNRMQVTSRKFEEQMAYLAGNGYQVLPLSQMQYILDGSSSIPEKAVVLTFDDGYRSVYDIAFPILKKYGFTATLFVYTDFIGGSAAMSWQQVSELKASGVIAIESHTKTHADLSFDPDDENIASHTDRVIEEVAVAARVIKDKVGYKPIFLAYPFGNSSDYTIEYLKKSHYALALTVKKGTNSAFADPYLLQRTMIYEDHTLDQFAKIINGFRPEQL